jgi:small subunit ribosomal protein S16
MKGAQPTDTVRAILGFKGVLYRKHLQRGVTKGALTQEKADQMYAEWVSKKEATIESRKATTAAEKQDYHRKVFGVKPEPKPVPTKEETKED